MAEAAKAASTLTSILQKGIVPKKSAEDDRDYLAFTLKNGINCLVCCDKTCDKAAAALSVEIGHWSDPVDVPGLAHFCEHMLFLGTEKYPVEGEYKEFLKANGGRSNAYTSWDHTCYFFDVNQDMFTDALDRFSQFFVSPLFDESCVTREIQAVHNEHKKNLISDGRRLYQLDKHLAAKNSVYNRFGTGDETTLSLPDIRDRLLKFYKEYYSASIMCLGLVGRQNVEELRSIAESMFSDVPSTGSAPPKFEGTKEDIFPQFSAKRHVETVKDLRYMNMKFLVDPTHEFYRERPTRCLSHLIGDETKGSILSVLKQKEWINELSAGLYDVRPQFSTFRVFMELTEEGLNHIDEIAQVVFEYIKLMQDLSDEQFKMYWEEAKVLSTIRHQFKDRERSYNYCTKLARGMSFQSFHATDPERDLPLTLEYMSSIPFECNPKREKEFLTLLTPENCEIRIMSQSELKGDVLTEPIYGVNYSQDLLSPEFLKSMNEAVPRKDLKVVGRNPYLPENFDILPMPDPNPENPTLLEHPSVKIYYKKDDAFLKPKAFIYLKVEKEEWNESAKYQILGELWDLLIRDALQEDIYQPSVAGMQGDISFSTNKVYFQFRGYNHRFPSLLDIVLKVADLELDETRFNLQKERLDLSYKNYWKSDQYNQTRANFSCFVDQSRFTQTHLQNELDKVTFAECVSFHKSMWQNVSVEGLSFGNISQEMTLDFVNRFCDALKCTFAPELPNKGSSMLRAESPNHAVYALKSKNPDEENGAIHTSFEIDVEKDMKLLSLLRLYASMANAPAFQYLRTEKQLGYIVWTTHYNLRGCLRFVFMIQSSKFSPPEMDQEVENFLKNFHETVRNIDADELEQKKESLALDICKRITKIGEQHSKFWREISLGRFEFDFRERHADVVRKITKEELVSFVDTYMDVNGPQRSKMSIWQYGNKHDLKKPELTTENSKSWAGDILWMDTQEKFEEFRQSLPQYQYPYPRQTEKPSKL